MEINNLLLLNENISSKKRDSKSEGTQLIPTSGNILVKLPGKVNGTTMMMNHLYSLLTKKPRIAMKENDVSDLIQFYSTPLKDDQLLKCDILERDGNYFLYSHETGIFMLSAFKIKKKLRHNYFISCDHSKETPPYCIGRLNASITNTEFILYDNGGRPDDSSSSPPSPNRRYMLEVKMNQKSPFKQATVFLPSHSTIEKYYNSERDKRDKLSLLARDDENIHQMSSLNPEWSSLYQSFIQNQSSRILEASKNNFQIALSDKQRDIVIDCGKINSRVYALDFAKPFSPLQAFAIALSFIM